MRETLFLLNNLSVSIKKNQSGLCLKRGEAALGVAGCAGTHVHGAGRDAKQLRHGSGGSPVT